MNVDAVNRQEAFAHCSFLGTMNEMEGATDAVALSCRQPHHEKSVSNPTTTFSGSGLQVEVQFSKRR
jgi:hypothetical protein